jgi:nitrogen-specific signal transduction histidine kinase
VVSRDVTDQAAKDEELRLAKLAAEQANHAKSEYLSRMSHELRTPLNAILGFAQLLELDHLHDEQRDNLGHIMSGARHLLSLINEVLDIAAIEAGRLTLSLEPVPLADVVAETVSLIRPLADQRNIMVAAPDVACSIHVLGDRQRLKQVLLNLLSNAVKYNRDGGSVELSCAPVADDRLRVKVADTGLGIPPEALARLFVPFERVGRQSGIEGTGLGLPLSKRLAEAMGGNLDLTSTPDQGSTFWIELPLAEGPVEQDEREGQDETVPVAELEEPAGPPITVLYIEDNMSNLRLVERILGRRPGGPADLGHAARARPGAGRRAPSRPGPARPAPPRHAGGDGPAPAPDQPQDSRDPGGHPQRRRPPRPDPAAPGAGGAQLPDQAAGGEGAAGGPGRRRRRAGAGPGRVGTGAVDSPEPPSRLRATLPFGGSAIPGWG